MSPSFWKPKSSPVCWSCISAHGRNLQMVENPSWFQAASSLLAVSYYQDVFCWLVLLMGDCVGAAAEIRKFENQKISKSPKIVMSSCCTVSALLSAVYCYADDFCCWWMIVTCVGAAAEIKKKNSKIENSKIRKSENFWKFENRDVLLLYCKLLYFVLLLTVMLMCCAFFNC